MVSVNSFLRMGTAQRSLRMMSTTAKTPKVVIIGGVAGGATAAARASRLTSNIDITVIERSPDVSFANCGLPYYIGKEITDRSKLALQTPESLSKQLNVKVLTQTDAYKINREDKTVAIRNLKGETQVLPYDKLILSPGASPIRPKVKGIEDSRIFTLRNLQDMDKIDAIVKNPNCKNVAVIGAGFIGLEMVEQLHRLGKNVHLIEKSPAVLPQADVEMAEYLNAPLAENGIQASLGDGLVEFQPTPEKLTILLESGKKIPCDLAVLCIGVSPESSLAKDAKLKTNNRGYVQVNEFMQTSDPNIYAVGDVIETQDLVFPDRKASIALGNVANMQARIAADHMILGKSIPYKGSLGTSIVRLFDTVLALTGWNEKRLKASNIPYATTTITTNDHASYYPGAMPITMKLLFDPVTGRVLGAQAVGIQGVDKRIDVIATAIHGGLTIDDLSLTQLSYSPPFGSARDVVNVAGLAARNIKEQIVKPVYSFDAPSDKKVVTLDVRPRENAAMSPIPNSINIPFAEVRDRAKELDPSVEYRTVCALGKTAYFASRQLINAGFNSTTLIGGLQLHRKPKVEVSTQPHQAAPTPLAPATTVVQLDCSGMACPGPLLKLKESLNTLPPNSILEVKATDQGFKADVKAFASSNGLTLADLKTDKGVIRATLIKGDAITAMSNAANAAAAGPSTGVRKGATIVVFSQEMDKVLASLVIANGAAAMGGEVTMFFTFWGLNALRHPDRNALKPKGFLDMMFGLMMPKGQDRLPLSNMNFGGAGTELMKYVMNQKQLPNITGLLKSAKAQNIRIVACTMSMDAMGITKEEFIDGVELGGVADYLAASEKSGTNLFI